jgi:hypothetical protein
MHVTVDEVEYPLRTGSLDVTNAIGQRSVASVRLRDPDGTNHFEEGQRVEITDDDGVLVYGGFIDANDEDALGTASTTENSEKPALKDGHYLADKRLAAKSYDAGMMPGDIFNDLLDTILVEEGVYAVRNILSANQSDVETDATGFTALNSATLTRDTTQQQHGAASLKAVTPGSVTNEGFGVYLLDTAYRAGQTVIASVYLRGAGDVVVKFVEAGVQQFVFQDITLSNSGWTRYSLVATLPSSLTSGHSYGIEVATRGTAQAVTFYADALMIEPKATSSTAPSAWELGGTSTIATGGVALPDVVLNYGTVAESFDAITQKSGAYWWQIDQWFRLWFQPYAAIPAPWDLTADGSGVVTDARYGTVHVKRGKPMYRNRQYIRGATGTTDAQTEDRKGDGTTTAFTFGFPFAKVPTVTLNGGAQTVGIKGLDTGKDWYWNQGDATLTQDSAGTVLISSDTLEVVYFGQYPLIIISEDSAEVTAQQTLEGGVTSGKVENIVEDTSLTTSDAAFQEASALLSKFAQKAVTLTFQTSRAGLAQGQLLHVNIPRHGLNDVDMLIESVHITDEGGTIIWYDVTALLGPVNTSWVQFFGQLVSQSQAGNDVISVGASTALVIAADFDADYTSGESASFTATVYACPLFPFTFPATLC